MRTTRPSRPTRPARAAAPTTAPRRVTVLLATVLTALLTACGPAPTPAEVVRSDEAATATATPGAPSSVPEATPSATAAPAPGPPAAGTALAAVADLVVKGRAPRTGYDRDLFGDGWVDVDRNGCDTRNDVLARDLADVTTKPGTHGCVVLTGTLVDPYGGRTIDFVRGNDTSALVQVDHVVALSDAWQKGAQQWDGATRVAFANDPLNLLAVDGSLNAQKGDGDAATWLPPAKGYRCAYVARQVAVKRAYGLWVTDAERDAMTRVLGTCPHEPLPGGDAAPRGVPEGVSPAVPRATPEPPSEPFENCAAARAAGAAPVRAGEPGYGRHLDRDGDGVGCE